MKLGEDGITLEEGWQSELGDELKEDKTLTGIRDIPGMAKMLVSAQKMVGADKVVLPGADATDDDWNAFYTSLGRPQEPEGYEGLEKPEGWPDEIPFDEERLKNFRGIAHKIGLTPKQVIELFNWDTGQTKAIYEGNQRSLEDLKKESEKYLREKWGDKYNDNRKKALVAVRTFVAQDKIEKFDENGLGNIPWLVEAFAKVGDAISEDKLAISHISDNRITAKAEIDRIMGDPTHPYHDKAKSGHVEAVSRVQDLYKLIYPE